MPFGESQNKIYTTIVEGSFAVRSSESDPKAVKRELKSGSIIWEKRYKTFTGRIKDIGFKQNDHNGKKWEELIIVIDDGRDTIQLALVFPGKYSNSFLRTIKNVELKDEIIFSPWTKIVDGKTKAALFLNRPNVKDSIPWYHTKETPHGLPELESYTVPGSTETKWSDIKRNVYFRSMLENDIVPKLREIWSGNNNTQASGHVDNVTHFNEDITDIEPVDDLPF